MGTTPNPLDPVNADLDAFTADLSDKLAAIATEIAGLKAGTPVTQAQIDSVRAKIAAAKNAVDTFSA